jgi:multidrug efflux pump subunit AcrA (membrane-fusion protein)
MDAVKASPTDASSKRIDRTRSERVETKTQAKPQFRRTVLLTICGVLVVAGATTGFVTRQQWLPPLASVMGAIGNDSHDHDLASELEDTCTDSHAGEDQGNSLALSLQGQKNVGLSLVAVQLRDFDRTISVPAMIVGRPGRTELTVSAPMTGIVTRIIPNRGEAVSPGQPLFTLRLTHEDIVEKQSALLRALEELDVVRREVARVEKVTSSGAIAGKALLERQYEQQKIEAAIRADRQALTLHGLSEEQIDDIVTNRHLLQELTIVAPATTDCTTCADHEEYLQVAELAVTPGSHIQAGDRLATVMDHCELYIEGRAFEEDADALTKAANAEVPATAVIEGNGSGRHEITGLQVLYIENQVEQESRALKFYVQLPNELVRNAEKADGRRFIGWRYKPGQRVQLHIPVETWENRVVLPVDALVQEGADWFVFQKNGDQFDRRPVHVEYRDQRWAVIEADGTLFPGDVVAATGAYQMHLALKNKAGGGVDPHAGHNH